MERLEVGCEKVSFKYIGVNIFQQKELTERGSQRTRETFLWNEVIGK